jgi:DNA-binding CsgD family transcriptional regulator
VAQAASELAAAGVRLRRPALSGVDALTPSERRVAEMAATGMTNPEIAQALFLTRKTIEMHLGRAYRKLSVSGRSELTGLFGK